MEWSFIEKTLEFFNFGTSYISWIKTLYNGASSAIINNGWISEYLNISRGVRQGCPLSPYLFVLASEILAINIRTNQKIKGININNVCTKIIQYADDTCLPLAYDKQSLSEVIKSGLKVNYDKTQLLRIGSLRDSDDKINIKWTKDSIMMLGVKITTDWTQN